MGSWVRLVIAVTLLNFRQSSQEQQVKMEAIKKKVQAMKVEKDNLCDRCDEVEQKMKESLIRKDKAEEEFTELSLKARTLEIDLDKYAEKLEKQVMAQESKEAQVLAAEAEFNSLKRTWRSQSRNMFLLFRSTTRPPLLLTTATAWPRCCRTEPPRTRLSWLASPTS